MNRSSALLLALLAFIACFLFLALRGSEESHLVPQKPAAPVETAEPAPELSRETVPNQLGPLQMLDKVSGQELLMNAAISQASSDVMEIESGELVDLSHLEEGAEISIRSPNDDELAKASVAESIDWTGEEWRSVLPYNAGLTVSIVGAPENTAGRHGIFYLLPSPDTLTPEIKATASPGDRFSPELENMSFEGKVKWLLRRKLLVPLAKQAADEEYQAEMFEHLEGAFVVLWMDAAGNQAMGAVELLPGATSSTTLVYRPRPTISGRLLDWNGEPVPNGKFYSIVNLDLTNYDYLPQDRHAFGAVRSDRAGLIHTIQKSYFTDESGRFSITVPKGREHAFQSFERESYAYWSTIDSGSQVGDALALDLCLMEPVEENITTVIVQDPFGNPLLGAQVILGYVDDLPYLRQSPLLKVDVNGMVNFVGLPLGAQIEFSAHHDKITCKRSRIG